MRLHTKQFMSQKKIGIGAVSGEFLRRGGEITKDFNYQLDLVSWLRLLQCKEGTKKSQ